MVRIVGGRARGTRIEVPKGLDVRPTADRIREALFNVLAHRFDDPCWDARVLDLFAGSGALGLEAMSRGAESVDFVEANQATAEQLRQNAQRIGENWQLKVQKAEVYLAGRATPFDLVFLDPPYHGGQLSPILKALLSNTWLKADSLVCVEHPAEHSLDLPDGFCDRFERAYGSTAITILARL